MKIRMKRFSPERQGLIDALESGEYSGRVGAPDKDNLYDKDGKYTGGRNQELNWSLKEWQNGRKHYK